MKNETSQKEATLNVLQEKGHLSSIEAINDMGITRLSSIIYDLRAEGHVIKAVRFKSNIPNRYGNHSNYCIYYYEGKL